MGLGARALKLDPRPRRVSQGVDQRGRDGGVREKLTAGVVQLKPKTEVEATSILPP